MADGDTTTIAKEEFDKLQAKYDRTLGELTDVKKTLDKFKGVDLEKLQANSQALADLEKERAKESPDKLEKWKESELKKLRDEVATELKGAKEAAERLTKENKELKVTDKVFSTIAPKFNQTGQKLLKNFIREHCDLDENGEILVKGADGQPRFKNGNERFTVDDYGADLAKEYPDLAAATFTGGGKQNGTATKGSIDLSSIRSTADLNRLPDPQAALNSMTIEQLQALGKNTRI